MKKKIIIIGMVALASMSLAACSNNKSGSESNSQRTEKSSKTSKKNVKKESALTASQEDKQRSAKSKKYATELAAAINNNKFNFKLYYSAKTHEIDYEKGSDYTVQTVPAPSISKAEFEKTNKFNDDQNKAFDELFSNSGIPVMLNDNSKIEYLYATVKNAKVFKNDSIVYGVKATYTLYEKDNLGATKKSISHEAVIDPQ